jgi:hypothetical protein
MMPGTGSASFLKSRELSHRRETRTLSRAPL